jgi:cell division protein FtsB
VKKPENPFRNTKVVVRSCPPLLKIVLIALIVLSVTALAALGWVNASIRAQTQEMREEAATLLEENAELEEKIGELGSVQSVQDIAQEELGLVDPNTVIINPNS